MKNINVQARGCEVEDALREHFDEKLSGLERHWSEVDEAIIRLSCERGRYVAEITLVSGGLVTRGEERAGNLRQAFDSAIEKLEAQLRRHKKKQLTRQRHRDNRDGVAGEVLKPTIVTGSLAANPPSSNGGAPGSDVAAAETADGAHDDAEEDVVRVKRFALKPMSSHEAALQMDLLGHDFFVFRDAESHQTSVVYRRHSGGYGLIEPVAD